MKNKKVLVLVVAIVLLAVALLFGNMSSDDGSGKFRMTLPQVEKKSETQSRVRNVDLGRTTDIVREEYETAPNNQALLDCLEVCDETYPSAADGALGTSEEEYQDWEDCDQECRNLNG